MYFYPEETVTFQQQLQSQSIQDKSMVESSLLAALDYNELDHGWALDTGCFVAARCLALGSLAHTTDEPTRTKLLEHIRSYDFNIQRRLVTHGSSIEGLMFQPNYYHHMGSTMAAVAAKVQAVHSTAHCVFLLLGSATTFVELGMKSAMRQGCNAGADSVIKQLLAMGSQMFPPGTQMEALRFELSLLRGNIDRLRRILLATSKPRSPNSSYVCIADIRDSTFNSLSGERAHRRLIEF